MCFKNINVYGKPTRQKLTSWLQIVKSQNNVNLLVDVKYLLNAISG